MGQPSPEKEKDFEMQDMGKDVDVRLYHSD